MRVLSFSQCSRNDSWEVRKVERHNNNTLITGKAMDLSCYVGTLSDLGTRPLADGRSSDWLLLIRPDWIDTEQSKSNCRSFGFAALRSG